MLLSQVLTTFWPCLLLAALLGAALGWLGLGAWARERIRALEAERDRLAAEVGGDGARRRDKVRAAMAADVDRHEAAVAPEPAVVPAAAMQADPVDTRFGLDPRLAADSYEIEEIEGIGPAFGRDMRALGIATTADLLARGDGAEELRRIAARVQHDDVTEKVVRRWYNMADLCRIQGVRGQFAELLEFAGISSVVELARQKPDDLEARLLQVNERENRTRMEIRLHEVADWIRQAGGRPSELVFGENEEAARIGYEVEEIEGIGPGYGRRLRAIGISTTLDLLERGRDAEQRAAIAASLSRPDVDATVVGRWTSMADLMRVEGVMGQFAELIHFSGIQTVDELADQAAEALLARLSETNARENRVAALPNLQKVSQWISSARQIRR